MPNEKTAHTPWTKEQFTAAMNQIEDIDAFDGFLDYNEPEVVDALLDVFCQRNQLLQALQLILSNWPAHRDGMDYSEPLPVGVKAARVAIAVALGE